MTLEIKRRKRKAVSREEANGLMVSPCRGCKREERDKRYKQCKHCTEPYLYAMAVERVYSHLPPGIDCDKIYSSSNGQVKYLTEVRGVPV